MESSAQAADRPKLGVITPLANEEATVETFLRGVAAHLRSDDRLFCVLDNVCQDSTREKVARFAEADPRVVLVWAPENRCVVDAYFRGYRAALADDCGWILEMDGGLSHPPEDIPRFLAALATGADYVAGCRFIEGGRFRGRLSRRVISKGGTVLANWLLGTKMRDMTSGYEGFTRKAMQFVVDTGVRSRAHFFQTEIRVLLRDWRWVEVPFTYSCPSKSVGKASLTEAFAVLWSLYRQHRAALHARRAGEPHTEASGI